VRTTANPTAHGAVISSKKEHAALRKARIEQRQRRRNARLSAQEEMWREQAAEVGFYAGGLGLRRSCDAAWGC